MTRPPITHSDENPPGDQPVATERSATVAFGLSKTEFDELVELMLAVVWRVGCPGHIRPLEVVHDAFVLALCKPNSEKPPISERKKFYAWMCKLAKFAALSNRKSKHRRMLGQGHSDAEIGTLLSTAGHADASAAREALHKAFVTLEPQDQALVVTHHLEGKTISEIAAEQGLPRSTVDSRHSRAMSVLRAALQSAVVLVMWLFPKKTRAQGTQILLRGSGLLPQVVPATYAMAVTFACGVLVPTSSSAALPRGPLRDELQGTTVSAVVTVPTVALDEPGQTPEVAPEKPLVVDEPGKRCSASDMKATKISSYLQGTIVPFAFLVAPAMTQLACAGSERHPVATQEPEERDDSQDPYDAMCENERHRGNDCPSRADWYKSMGRCPDGTKGCQ